MPGVSETNQRKEYLACLSVAGNMPNISCGSTRVKVLLVLCIGVEHPDGQGLMAAARNGPEVTDIGPGFK